MIFDRGVNVNKWCALILLVSCIGCGEVVRRLESVQPSTSVGGIGTLVVLASDFVVGAITVVQEGGVSHNVETTHSDAVVRSYGGMVYVVNRLGQDNLQIIDPQKDFKTIAQWSTGRRTNPQDVYVNAAGVAYITLFEPANSTDPQMVANDLIEIDTQTGKWLGGLDLTPWTTAGSDRLARATHLQPITLSDGSQFLVVMLQNLPANLAQAPNAEGVLVLIDLTQKLDSAALAVAGTIPLTCRDPVSFAYSAAKGRLYVSCADFFSLSGQSATQWGGIEVVDVEHRQSLGLWIADEVLGGAPGDIILGKGYGFVTVGFLDPGSKTYRTKVVRFADDPAGLPALTDVYSSKGFIQAITFAADDTLVIGDRWPEVAGLVFVNPDTLQEVRPSAATGLPPSSITLVP